MSELPDPRGYRLARDTAASIRLNAQHYNWKAISGFNLHPTITSATSPDAKIADVATGTGIWITDVKCENPGYTIDGFDISLQLCPPEGQWLSGCTYRQLDMLDELPEELHGAYDVVHVRLVLGALKNDPRVALGNFIAMLKPGGYLQWQEFNPKQISVAEVNPTLRQTATAKLVDIVRNFEFGEWVSDLAATCSELGLVDCHTHKYRLPPHLAMPHGQNEIAAYEEISLVSMDNSTPDARGPEFRRLLDEVAEELRAGVWIDKAIEITVARKPSH